MTMSKVHQEIASVEGTLSAGSKPRQDKIVKRSTGLPGKKRTEFEPVWAECLNCGHKYKGAEFDDLLSWDVCFHCDPVKGFKAYNEEGDYIVIGPGAFVRDYSEIEKKEEEFSTRVGYEQRLGSKPADPMFRRAKKEYKENFGNPPKEIGEWQAGYWSGQLAALKWVLGEEEHALP